jgi:hypothetical protein
MLVSWLALPPAQQVVMVAFAALPTASSAYVLAVRMGGHGAYTAGLVTVSTLLGMVALPLWLMLVRMGAEAFRAIGALGQRPVDVFAHQLAGRAWPRRRACAVAVITRRAPGVAQGHRQVAAPACPADAPDGAACAALQEVGSRQAHSCSSVAVAQALRVRQSRAARLRCAYLFQGQASWQSSQP